MSVLRLLPWPVHEALEYLAGVFLILAPFLFGFRDEQGAVFPLFVGVGVGVLAVAVLSKGPAGIVGVVPTAVHATLDYLLGFLLILAPFVFRFSDVDAAVLIAVFFGVAHLVISLVTRFPVDADDRERSEVA